MFIQINQNNLGAELLKNDNSCLDNSENDPDFVMNVQCTMTRKIRLQCI